MNDIRLHAVLVCNAARGKSALFCAVLASLCLLCVASSGDSAEKTTATQQVRFFNENVAPILTQHCLECHNEDFSKGDLSLSTAESIRRGGESGPVIEAGDPDSSYLMLLLLPEQTTESTNLQAEMPREKPPLSDAEQKIIRQWIEQGAILPEDLHLKPVAITDTNWWSFQPLNRPKVPRVKTIISDNPIDAFILSRLQKQGLAFSPEADRRTLIRRAYFDLIGLPPTPEQIEAFIKDNSDDAYPRLVDQLLASPRYGERWARHWLDVAHYGDTHGYDKDKPRNNAWPYRDYVIRSLNDDKNWSRFVQEQIAGDAMFPESSNGIVAMGFISAGPWDFVGHAEVSEAKTDGKIARHLDRDDMVRSTIESFCSLTVGCAQCHHHKFDPISQDDYYALQAVFAALDRADQDYFNDPSLMKQYRKLKQDQEQAKKLEKQLVQTLHDIAGEELKKNDEQIAAAKLEKKGGVNPAYGYHSAISIKQETAKWVQIDLGKSVEISRIVLRPCFDNYNSIGAGFGFPVRFIVEASNDPNFDKNVIRIDDPRVLSREQDFVNPGILPVELLPLPAATDLKAQYVRVTATKLASRKGDYIFSLAEVEITDAAGNNVAAHATVSAKDSVEALPRWAKTNLVDGIAPESDYERKLADLNQARQELLQRVGTPEHHQKLKQSRGQLAALQKQIEKFPKPKKVYSGTVHKGSGSFVGRAHLDGLPREIFLLKRGDVNKPDYEVVPGTLSLFSELASRFPETKSQPEQHRRVALAKWLTSTGNPLTWRSAVNRVWQYHFGTGIADTPNDFGHMGGVPSHPELLDWLAVNFRDRGQSLKQLHRLMMTSRTYKQTSHPAVDQRVTLAKTVDSNNRLLWKMSSRKLGAEAIRDSILFVSGKMNLKMGGPAFQDFIIEKPQHSPHYQYHLHDPADPKTHRRSVYRFIVRSQLQPFMNTLDCADPSLSVPTRNESLTPLQSLTMLNNGLIVTMSHELAEKLKAGSDNTTQMVTRGFYEAIGRQPDEKEQAMLIQYTKENGLENYCRLLFNMNEFTFID